MNLENLKSCDEDEWITKNGSHILIDGENGTVKGGAGGKLTGKTLNKKSGGESQSGATSPAHTETTKTESSPSPQAEVHKRHPALQAGHEEFNSPIPIMRETEKAYGISNPAYERAKEIWGSGSDYERHRFNMETSHEERFAFQSKQSLNWMPKSQISAHEGHIIGGAGWLAEKHGVSTKEATAKQEQRFEAGKQRYEDLLTKAKAAGVKGIRARMKSSTIKEKMKEQGISFDHVEYEDELMDWAMDSIESTRKTDVNGYITIEKNPISRSGVFQYMGRSLPDADPDKIYNVLRPENELSNPDTLKSFEMLPIIDEHAMLGEGYQTSAEDKGVHGITGSNVSFDSGILYSPIRIFSDKLKSLIASGKKQLSAGYRCVFEKSSGVFDGKEYHYIQRNIRGNHIALVHQGRSGADIAVLDGVETMVFDHFDLDVTQQQGDEQMAVTLEQAMDAIEKLTAKVVALDEKFEAKEKEDEEEKKKAEDASKEEEEKKAEDDDKEEEDDEKKKEKKEGMDAAIVSRLEAVEKRGVKELLAAVSKRDSLAKSVSEVVGTFDHAEMTLDEVAGYALGKIGLTASKGQEHAVLSGYMAGRKASASNVGFSMDTTSKPKEGGLFNKFLTKGE